MRTDSFSVEIGLPPLSDEAAVEMDDFLIDFLGLFESHYGTFKKQLVQIQYLTAEKRCNSI